MTEKVLYCEGQTVFLKCGQNIVPVFPVYFNCLPYHPIVTDYLSTTHKVMGQTLPHATLVCNCRYLSPALGYVTLSRVSSLDNAPTEKNVFLNYWKQLLITDILSSKFISK